MLLDGTYPIKTYEKKKRTFFNTCDWATPEMSAFGRGLDREDVRSRPSVSTSHLPGLDLSRSRHYIGVTHHENPTSMFPCEM